MRVLIFHGYLLSGTGSNVYNAALAEALAHAGHEVHLLCQEPDPLAFDWVDATGDWDGGSLAVRARREPARVTVYRPDIGGVLPLYVADRYEGFDARPFQDLSETEVERYLAANVAAVRDVAERARPDVALANHLVLGPAILARAGLRYAVKVHGSALEYTVKPHPRFLPYAREGLAGARGILVGSRHTAESLWGAMGDPSLPARTRLGPPGVDVARFVPREPAAAREGLAALESRLAAEETVAARAGGDSFARAAGEAAGALGTVGPEDRLVVFVGKLIASKGVELLLAAWPLVLAREPRARLLIVGFGAFRPALEGLVADLDRGDLAAARGVRGENGEPLAELQAFLERAPDGHGRGMAARVAFAGRLDHAELEHVLPAAEAMAVPSTFPEAFGMVAAEAAACGALPVVAAHSGLAEVADTLARAVPVPVREWLSFEVGPGAVGELADDLASWLEAPADLRAATRDAVVAATRATYSWDGVARAVIAAAAGELDDLPSPTDRVPPS